MKYPIWLAILLLLSSCTKEPLIAFEEDQMQKDVCNYLKDNFAADDFRQLNFKELSVGKYDSGLVIVVVPFMNTIRTNHYVAIKLSKTGLIDDGKIVTLDLDKIAGDVGSTRMNSGSILIQSLSGQTLTRSLIKDGQIQSADENNSGYYQRVPANAKVIDMPEVLIIGTVPTSGGSMSFSAWTNIMGVFNGFSSTGTFYQNSSSSSAGGGGGSSSVIQVDLESGEELPIQVAAFIKCFGGVADAGSICSVRICTDLPIDSDPNKFFDFDNGSPGHTFLQFTKTNAGQTVQQNIGFYPASGWKNFLTTAPVEAKFVNNEGHEFNASLSMNLTPENFNATLVYLQRLSGFVKYDIDDYNCTDIAMEVFNYKRGGNQLDVRRVTIPGGASINGTATPQMLYQKIKEMNTQQNPEHTHISIPGVKGFVGISQGACN